jgi:V8-like Glu-specific endopeptidase
MGSGSPLEWLKSLMVGRPLPPGRVQVQNPTTPPYEAIALLNYYRHGSDSPYGRATGFYLKADLVVTAAHNFTITKPAAVGIYPAFDAELNPVDPVGAVAWAWHPARDIGVLISPPQPSHFGLHQPQDVEVALVGYAYPYPNNTGRMSVGVGPCSLDGLDLKYPIPARDGDSGAPVFIESGFNVVAVHSELRQDPNTSRTYGVGEAVDPHFPALIQALEAEARAQLQ